MILGVLGGQVPRLYGGTISWGGVTHLGGFRGALQTNVPFFDTFVTA